LGIANHRLGDCRLGFFFEYITWSIIYKLVLNLICKLINIIWPKLIRINFIRFFLNKKIAMQICKCLSLFLLNSCFNIIVHQYTIKEFFKKFSRYSTIMKNTDNSTTIKPIMLKIYMQVVSDPLNNFTYGPRVDFLWPKCLNHAMKVKKARRGQ
jgi:hypothetical protein